jgi:hypothetical protein
VAPRVFIILWDSKLLEMRSTILFVIGSSFKVIK